MLSFTQILLFQLKKTLKNFTYFLVFPISLLITYLMLQTLSIGRNPENSFYILNNYSFYFINISLAISLIVYLVESFFKKKEEVIQAIITTTPLGIKVFKLTKMLPVLAIHIIALTLNYYITYTYIVTELNKGNQHNTHYLETYTPHKPTNIQKNDIAIKKSNIVIFKYENIPNINRKALLKFDIRSKNSSSKEQTTKAIWFYSKEKDKDGKTKMLPLFNKTQDYSIKHQNTIELPPNIMNAKTLYLGYGNYDRSKTSLYFKANNNPLLLIPKGTYKDNVIRQLSLSVIWLIFIGLLMTIISLSYSKKSSYLIISSYLTLAMVLNIVTILRPSSIYTKALTSIFANYKLFDYSEYLINSILIEYTDIIKTIFIDLGLRITIIALIIKLINNLKNKKIL